MYIIMNKKSILLIISVILITTVKVNAQDSEANGIWTSIGINKDITKYWSAGIEAEYRTLGFTAERERTSFQIASDYEILKNLKIGIGYSLMSVYDDYKFSNDSIRVHYQDRNRFYGQLNYRLKFGNFSLSFRERAQLTYKDESDRINAAGIKNTNRINPDLIWRNRFKLQYSKKKLAFSPYISFESYFMMNDPEIIRIYNNDLTSFNETSSYFNKMRYAAGIEYKINKKHAVELYGILSSERAVEEVKVSGPNYLRLGDWVQSPVIGIGYSFIF